MENLSYVLIPVAFVSVVLVGLVLLFARDRATMILRNLYLYGVVAASLLVAVTSVVFLFYTLLTTTIFPTTTSQYYGGYDYRFESAPVKAPPGTIGGVVYNEDAKTYLKAEQKKLDLEADSMQVTQEWRDQLAWTIPLILVFLPIFFRYRRFLTTLSHA